MGNGMVKIRLEMGDQKLKLKGNGFVILTDEGERISITAGGLLEPRHLAEALIHNALSDEEGSEIVRDLVIQIMLKGCQEQELVDNASFVLETARMIRDVLGEDGEK